MLTCDIPLRLFGKVKVKAKKEGCVVEHVDGALFVCFRKRVFSCQANSPYSPVPFNPWQK